MVVRTTKKATAAPAKKAAAPAKKATPAPKPAPKAAPARKAAPAKPAVEKVTAYDVLRADKAVEKAQQEYYRIKNLFWQQNEGELSAAVEHAEKMVEEITPAPRTGRKPAETPSAKARAKDPVIGEFYDIDDTRALGLRDLRDLAADLAEKGLITETMKKPIILKQMEDAGLFRAAGNAGTDEDDIVDDDEDLAEDEEAEEYEDEAEDESDDSEESDDDDEADDDSEDEDDEDGYSLDDLKKMKLKQLQDLAEQNEIDWDGLSKDDLIAELWGEDEDEEDEDESEDEEIDDEEDEEEEDDEETIEIDLADLPGYDTSELVELANKIGLKIPVSKRKDKKFLIKKIEDALTAPDEDEDDEE
jgi:hypothetical protein